METPPSPTVSVVVPVYKAEAWLPRCVESLLAQAFPDFELLLIDDGSPDGCGALCDGFACRDGRVRALHQTNGGASSARNAGIRAARGRYLTFVDSDDLVSPHLLQAAAEAAGGLSGRFCILGLCRRTLPSAHRSAYQFPHPLCAQRDRPALHQRKAGRRLGHAVRHGPSAAGHLF